MDASGAGVVTRAITAPLGALRPGRPPRARATPVLPGRGMAWPPLTAVANRARRAGVRVRPRRLQPLADLHFPLDTLPGWPLLQPAGVA